MKNKTKGNVLIFTAIAISVAIVLGAFLMWTPRKVTVKEKGLKQFETREDLEWFLAQDDTDLYKYGANVFGNVTEGNQWDCVDFANRLRLNALEEGYDLDILIMTFENVGHAINMTRLQNGKLLYIEPQTDEIFENLDGSYFGMKIVDTGVID